MLHWHIDTDAVSLIVIAAIYIYCLRFIKMLPEKEKTVQDKHFLRCLLFGVIITAVDIAASVVMEVPVIRPVYHLFMTAYFILIEFGIVEWSLYVFTILFSDNKRLCKIYSRIAVYIFIFYAAFVLSNPWTGLIYSLGENNEYVRGPLFPIMIVLFAVYTIFQFVLTIIRRRHIQKKYSAAVLLLTPVLLATSIVIQLSFSGLLMIMPAYMICLVLAFLYLQTVRVRNNRNLLQTVSKVATTDQLTGLMNRTGMENAVRNTWLNKSGKRCMVALLDLDGLKQINDALGHRDGDMAIKLLAARLSMHFEHADAVVRFGGDEFLILVSDNVSEAYALESVKSFVLSCAEIYIGENNDTPVTCSLGFTVGTIGLNSFESLCSKADIALYHVKRNGKNGYAFYKPEMETTK